MREHLMVNLVGSAPQSASGQSIAEAMILIAELAQSRSYTLGLRPSQWMGLRYFANATAENCTVTAMAAHFDITRGAASQTAENLVAKGLLTRVPVPEDRRVSRLRPTERAFELLACDPLREFAAIIDDLPFEQRRMLAAILFPILEVLWDRSR